MSSNTKIVCECGCEMLKKSYNRHLLTNKHNELMKLKNNNNDENNTLDNYFKDNHQDNKPIIAEPVNTLITAEKVNLIEKPLQNEPIIIIPKKFTKSDYIDMLLYHLNKDNNDPNKRVTLTNLKKAKIDQIKKSMIKYGITDEKQTYYDMIKNNLIEEEKEKREIEELERIMDEQKHLRYIKELKIEEAYNNLPEYIKRLCQKKLEYEKYTNEIKYQLNTIKYKNELMKALKKDGVNWDDMSIDVINLNGVNINICGLKEIFHHKIYLNNCVKEIIEEYQKYNEMGLEYI